MKKIDLIMHLRDLGIKSGDVVMVHISNKAVHPVDCSVDEIIDSFIDIVGENGTVIFPTFTFSYCQSRRWSSQNSPSEMGLITEIFRKRKGVLRSFHPIYSVAAFGAKAINYSNCNDVNGVGDNSPFAKLIDDKAKVLAVGVGYNQSFTLGHHIEWKMKVTYRYNKPFPGEAISSDGNVKFDNYEISVRDIDRGILTDYRKLGQMLEDLEVVRMGPFGNAEVRLINAEDFNYWVTCWLKDEIPYLMYQDENLLDPSRKKDLLESYYEIKKIVKN